MCRLTPRPAPRRRGRPGCCGNRLSAAGRRRKDNGLHPIQGRSLLETGQGGRDQCRRHPLRQRRPRVLLSTIRDRKSVVWGKRVSVSVELGGRRYIKKKININLNRESPKQPNKQKK